LVRNLLKKRRRGVIPALLESLPGFLSRSDGSGGLRAALLRPPATGCDPSGIGSA